MWPFKKKKKIYIVHGATMEELRNFKLYVEDDKQKIIVTNLDVEVIEV